MKDTKEIKTTQVKVQGKLTGHIDRDGTEHQVYRYHVNIHDKEARTELEYDREIHMFASVQKSHTEEEPANADNYQAEPTPAREETPRAEQDADIQAVELEPPAETTDIDSPVLEDTPPESIEDEPLSVPSKSPVSRRINIPKPDIRQITLHPLRRGLAQLATRLTAIKQRIRSFCHVPRLSFNWRPKLSRPKLGKLNIAKLVGKPNITARPIRFSKRGLLRFCLPCLVVSLLAIGLYLFMGQRTQTVKTIYPVEKPAKQDYQAVIEKTDNGVVITLQGPDHEEVLTKLPPGYDPIVEGNKIVHIVTPGNTLWFIAMRYIKNPYRYPELARLNNIPNPDLIYPGDKVVIQYIRRP